MSISCISKLYNPSTYKKIIISISLILLLSLIIQPFFKKELMESKETEHDRKEVDPNTSFTLMQWNILARCYTTHFTGNTKEVPHGH